jgi:hypothetical protein
MSSEPLIHLLFDSHINGGTVVYWSIEQLDDALPWTFTLQYGRAVNDDFEDITAGTNVCYLIDPYKRLWSKDPELYYRVKIVTSEGTYYSSPDLPVFYWDKRDWLYTRAIRRYKFLEWQKGGKGLEGVLLKRKIWGTACPDCTDENLNEHSLDSHCLTCYGTGLVGGYYDPIEYWVGDLGGGVKAARFSANSDLDYRAGSDKIAVEAIACPWLGERDLWIHEASDVRWAIVTRNPVIRVRNVTVVYQLELRQLPATNIAYDIPVTI